ncbi:EpsG family protein [Acinetobacter indicus]|uniref:EpsG family protein n=1 Tax=Acinetobacter indicus TaxID=756892 RepID=UPI0013B07177|nr:EpsG family protein [Acinetobacter indicus]QIC74737.1 EpsG family protein [Acinetobacter indicus]
MFDWVPLKNYEHAYYLVLAYFLIAVLTFSIKYAVLPNKTVYYYSAKVISNILLIFSIFYIGLRPISGQFVDMTSYKGFFDYLKNLSIFPSDLTSDRLFWYYMYSISRLFEAKIFFFITAFLYILPMYWVSKYNFKKLWFFGFFLFISAFSFFAYGTNGIRNGLATSVFLLVFSTNKKFFQSLWLLIAYLIHGSMLIPIVAFILSSFYRNTNRLIALWLACIPISLLFGSSIQTLFASVSGDDRTSYLIANVNDENAYISGFRWDFIAYSASAIIIGWYTKKRFNLIDRRYDLIFGTYLIANSIWILVINASFSNRFAYLSWFLMPLVVIYPSLKHYQHNLNDKMLIYITLFYFSFTLLMVLIYSL